MKTKILSLLAVLVTCHLSLVTAPAQVIPTSPVNVSPELKTSLISFVQGVSTNHSLILALYPSYAPDLNIDGKNKPWGAGFAALYPIAPDTLGNHVYTGLRFDYLAGQFFAASADVGLKADVQLFGHTFTPFVVGGGLIPLQGGGSGNYELGAIVGGGINTAVWQSANGKLTVNLFAEYEHWTLFNSGIYHGGTALNFKF